MSQGRLEAKRALVTGAALSRRFVALDVVAPPAWTRAMAIAASTWGGLDVLINNAGVALTARLSRIPAGRFANLEEVVSAVLYLASEESSYVTGGGLGVDGGALVQ